MSEVEATQAPIVLADLGKEALRDLLGNLTQAKAFVLEQAPEFCQQLVARDMGLSLAKAATLAVVAIAAVITAIVLLRQGLRAAKRYQEEGEYQYDGFVHLMFSGITAAIVVLALINAVDYAYTALSIHLAPKVYLVEQLMRMVK